MAEHREVVGNFMVLSSDKSIDFFIFHQHHDIEPGKSLYKACEPNQEGFFCRRCKIQVPKGIVYVGLTRRINGSKEV